ncbi:hypothetical protein RB195_017518 [Necator americanus]|uniref:Uncharacterized protein n=1 Tax=Necator americanus TaxID=51031 RepID=A0ABR1C8M4_NECAM
MEVELDDDIGNEERMRIFQEVRLESRTKMMHCVVKNVKRDEKYARLAHIPVPPTCHSRALTPVNCTGLETNPM